MEAIKPKDLERRIVDSTVQEKVIDHPVDSSLLEIARQKIVWTATPPPPMIKKVVKPEY